MSLYVFGDSFSTPGFCVEPKDSFWGATGKDLGVDKVVNYSHLGYSFDQIIHLLCNEQFDFRDSYFLIGIPPIERLAFFEDSVNLKKQPARTFDADFEQTSITTDCVNGLNQYEYIEIFDKEKKFLSKYNYQWTEIQTCDKILLLHGYLKYQQAKFIITNLFVPFRYDDQWPLSRSVMSQLKQLKECVLFDDTYYSVNAEDKIQSVDREPGNYMGHHGAKGNANWYNKVIRPKMEELGWL